MRINVRILLTSVSFIAMTTPSYAKQDQPARDSVMAEKQLQKQNEEMPIDFSGTWIDRDDLNTEAWWFRFNVAEDKIVITYGEAYSIANHVFAWAALTGRSFAGSMNSSPGPLGGSSIPLRIQGTISADNNEVDMTVYYEAGAPGAYHMVRRK